MTATPMGGCRPTTPRHPFWGAPTPRPRCASPLDFSKVTHAQGARSAIAGVVLAVALAGMLTGCVGPSLFATAGGRSTSLHPSSTEHHAAAPPLNATGVDQPVSVLPGIKAIATPKPTPTPSHIGTSTTSSTPTKTGGTSAPPKSTPKPTATPTPSPTPTITPAPPEDATAALNTELATVTGSLQYAHGHRCTQVSNGTMTDTTSFPGGTIAGQARVAVTFQDTEVRGTSTVNVYDVMWYSCQS